MDKITQQIKEYEHKFHCIVAAMVVVFISGLINAKLIEWFWCDTIIFEVFAWILLAVLVVLALASIYVKCFCIKPLVDYKLHDLVDTGIEDPDFDYDKYIHTR